MAPHNRPLISSTRSHEQRLSQLQPPSKLGLIVPAPWQNPSPDRTPPLISREVTLAGDGHQAAVWLIIGCPQSQETAQGTHLSDSESSALLSDSLINFTFYQHGSRKGVMRDHTSAPILPLWNMNHVHGNTSKDINMRSDSGKPYVYSTKRCFSDM